MARVEDSYPTPIQGVSTLAPRNRAEGTAGLQENMRSDPVSKLTRRPSLQWETVLLEAPNDVTHHSYYRDEEDISYIIEDNGTVHGYVNGVEKAVVGTLGAYGAGNLRLTSIGDDTYVTNTDVVTLMEPTGSEVQRPITHVNIINALSYSTNLTIWVTLPIFGRIDIASITVGDGSDGPVHDAARATNAVAAEIAAQVNAGLFNIDAVSKGSTVAIYYGGAVSGDPWVDLEIETGRSDDVLTFAEVVESPEGLPLYALPDTRIRIQPDPTKSAGTYYLIAESKRVGFGWDYNELQEVIWVEARDGESSYAFDASTLPHLIQYDKDTQAFTAGVTNWSDREVGDNTSVPRPAFIGEKITSISKFQNRLVFISNNVVSMTKTDQLYNWWKTSTQTLLATDPVEITSNATGIDKIQHAVEHNRDLLLIASNGQFKIDGLQGITPQSVALPLTTSQEIQVSVAPVGLGTAVFLPINYGTSTGVTRYAGSRDQQDIAEPITHHVIGYMNGAAKVLAGSPNLEMLALVTEDASGNELYIYEQFTSEGQAQQHSWSTWTIPEGNTILAASFRRDKLTLLCKVGTTIIQKSINMYSRVAVATEEVFLDDLLTLPTTGLTATLPSGYSTPNMVVVLGVGTIYPLAEIGYTVSGNTITFAEDIGAGAVYVGSPFMSQYQPTRPYVKDSKGVTVTSDRLRIGKFILNVVDTESVKMHIDSPYYDIPDQELSPRILGGLTNRLGVVDVYTGDYKFSYSQDADLATATFYTDGYLGMTISGISWEGQYNKSSRRLR